MKEVKLGLVESHFADIVWKNAPLTTRRLVELCAAELNWKRTTTYTVLKKLCDRGILETKDSVVSVLINKEEFHSIQSEQFVDRNFQGSLPAFFAAFTARKKPTHKELEEIRKLMDSMDEEAE